MGFAIKNDVGPDVRARHLLLFTETRMIGLITYFHMARSHSTFAWHAS